MIFDSPVNGVFFPRDVGANDMLDSARLAGLMALFSHPQAIDCSLYIVDDMPTRHPSLSPKDFSRDQLICWAAGLSAQHKEVFNFYLAAYYKPTNGDWLSPSQKDHMRRCAGLPDTWLGRQWLWLDILWSAFVNPMAEPNQLISMLVVAGPKWMKRWTRLNENWKQAIAVYWVGWRGEMDFSSHIIHEIERIIS